MTRRWRGKTIMEYMEENGIALILAAAIFFGCIFLPAHWILFTVAVIVTFIVGMALIYRN